MSTTQNGGSVAELQARQDRILATVCELREMDVPEPILEPIIYFAVTTMWIEAAERWAKDAGE